MKAHSTPRSADKNQRGGQHTAHSNGAITYYRAGVDVAGAETWLARMRPVIRSTWRSGILPDLGQFAGLFQLKSGRIKDPVLVASADGVGTKLKVAQLLNRHEAIGVDAVAMNTNDVLVYGAQPLFFLDYLAVGSLQPALMSRLLKGVAEGCRQSGCALLGGETAEMPGVYDEGEYDIAGFCVGIVERRKVVIGSHVRTGDAIVGLGSSGVHANGFSLIRRVFSASELRRFGKALLAPTRIYVKPVLKAVSLVSVKAIAHITGGGLTRRIPSLTAHSRGTCAELHEGRWRVPDIFRAIQAAGGISDEEMMKTFNMGIGMALVCAPAESARVVRLMESHKIPAWIIGRIKKRSRS